MDPREPWLRPRPRQGPPASPLNMPLPPPPESYPNSFNPSAQFASQQCLHVGINSSSSVDPTAAMSLATAHLHYASQLLLHSLIPPPPLIIAPTPLSSSSMEQQPPSLDQGSSSALRLRPSGLSVDSNTRLRLLNYAPTDTTVSDPPAKRPRPKPRGRPPCVKNKQTTQQSRLSRSWTSFALPKILVQDGEDVVAKIRSFCEEGLRSSKVIIFSAQGAVSIADIRLSTSAGDTVHFEGRYEIAYLSGICKPSEGGGHRTCDLRITLVENNGNMVRGSVYGKLIAASQVQISSGAYNSDGKQESSSKEKSGSFTSATPPRTIGIDLNAPASETSTSTTSQGVSGHSSSNVDDDVSSPLVPGNGTKSRSGDRSESGLTDDETPSPPGLGNGTKSGSEPEKC